MDRRIIPMTPSHKVLSESQRENSLPAPMNSPNFVRASSRSDLNAGLPRLGFSEESAVTTWHCGRQLQRISSEHL